MLATALPKSASSLPLFSKILIANRGEIAVRIQKTAHRLGIQTVSVFSDSDTHSQHTIQATEAFHIGASPSAESYLKMDTIIRVAKECGAEAIHPGYGFLSENAVFAGKCKEAGITFIGPPQSAIVEMGSKSASKNIMMRAKVPVVPGYHGDQQDVDFLRNEAAKIGYPVLIKAVLGGGGKGMRIVESDADFVEMLTSSRREAIKSFGDDRVLVERYIKKPRHIEVQVFCDTLGNAVYLFERDCSVQRRHQKILEEAPGPGISAELRKSLGETAVAAAKAVNYVGAGTVEFILDTDTNSYFFMEMNTRLQVEHPVTEMITGTDLVAWQLEVASGNRLPKLQEDLKIDGWSFEARIYAEDPNKNFMPDSGKIVHFKPPSESPTVRVETGVCEGDEVSVHYDPMICKLVVKGPTRVDALRVLRKALGEFEILGLQTNIEFLKSLASHPDFISGDVDTGFIQRHSQVLLPPPQKISSLVYAQAAMYLLNVGQKNSQTQTLQIQKNDRNSPWTSAVSFRLNSQHENKFEFKTKKEGGDLVEINLIGSGPYNVEVKFPDGLTERFDHSTALLKSPKRLLSKIGTTRIESSVVQFKNSLFVFSNGSKYELFMSIAESHTKDKVVIGEVVAPMPCKISSVRVIDGETVKKGQILLVLEAMKMEHVIKSPIDGVIKRVVFKDGDIVGEGKILVHYE